VPKRTCGVTGAHTITCVPWLRPVRDARPYGDGHPFASAASLARIAVPSYGSPMRGLRRAHRDDAPLCRTNSVNEDARMLTQTGNTILRGDLGVEETIESDNIVRWDGERLYVEQDVFHNGQLVHRKYRRTVSEPVAQALWAIINRAKQ
jgi:hypothetical protein